VQKEQKISEEMARAKREGSTLALGAIDIDHFKLVNDTYGHAAGDQVMREVVRRLTVPLRPYDALGRVRGKDSFC
jgi:diguanylate cyclase (GGDEF)-like protein